MAALKILVVEDEAITAVMLTEALGNLGYDMAKPVASAAAAVATAADFQPDIILMDVNLAGASNGIQAAHSIRAQQRTDFIFMTGFSDKESLGQIEQLQPLARLTKPVSPEAINDVIRSSSLNPGSGDT